jgi:hypothetical protein
MSLLIIAYHLVLRAMDSLGGSVARWESTADTQPKVHPAFRESVEIREARNHES